MVEIFFSGSRSGQEAGRALRNVSNGVDGVVAGYCIFIVLLSYKSRGRGLQHPVPYPVFRSRSYGTQFMWSLQWLIRNAHLEGEGARAAQKVRGSSANSMSGA